MSSLVCKGVQSCFDPCGLIHIFNQPTENQRPLLPLVLDHKEKTCDYEEFEKKSMHSDNKTNLVNNDKRDVGGWNFTQSLDEKNKQTNSDENVYVHPLVKKSSSKLSFKSLEMCTESLGSETGSDSNETSDEFSFPLSPKTNEEYRQMWTMKYEKLTKKVSRITNFPPPLTSISVSENIQVTPHREGGRLVLKAAKVSPKNSYFQAERVDGRLRLCLVDNNSPSSENDEIDGGYEQEEEEEEYGDDENWEEDVSGNNENIGGEMGIGERPIPRRCKESGHENKRIPNWEPCWVAIS